MGMTLDFSINSCTFVNILFSSNLVRAVFNCDFLEFDLLAEILKLYACARKRERYGGEVERQRFI